MHFRKGYVIHWEATSKWCLLSMIVHTSKYTIMIIGTSTPFTLRKKRVASICNLVVVPRNVRQRKTCTFERNMWSIGKPQASDASYPWSFIPQNILLWLLLPPHLFHWGGSLKPQFAPCHRATHCALKNHIHFRKGYVIHWEATSKWWLLSMIVHTSKYTIMIIATSTPFPLRG
jgi:hypothetical protein